jgi:hypothetical protein
MTIVCDKCGKSYFVARAVSRMGQLLRLACPHCGQFLWTNVPRAAEPRRPVSGPSPGSIRTRGFS